MNSSKSLQQRKPPEDRKHDLILAGIHCLSEGGISAFTIDNICKQAQVSRGLINHHFKSKDDLLTSIYSHMTEYLVQKKELASPFQMLENLIEKNFDTHSFKRSNLRAWLAIWGQVATNESLRTVHQKRYAKYKRHVTSAIREIAQHNRLDQDANEIARQFIALIDGLWLAYCLHSDRFSLQQAKTDCYQFISNYLGSSDLA